MFVRDFERNSWILTSSRQHHFLAADFQLNRPEMKLGWLDFSDQAEGLTLVVKLLKKCYTASAENFE